MIPILWSNLHSPIAPRSMFTPSPRKSEYFNKKKPRSSLADNFLCFCFPSSVLRSSGKGFYYASPGSLPSLFRGFVIIFTALLPWGPMWYLCMSRSGTDGPICDDWNSPLAIAHTQYLLILREDRPKVLNARGDARPPKEFRPCQ